MVEVALLGYGYIMDAVSSKRAEQGRKINKERRSKAPRVAERPVSQVSMQRVWISTTHNGQRKYMKADRNDRSTSVIHLIRHQ